MLKYRKALKSSKHLEVNTSETLVPSIPDIQRILVEDLKDKNRSFVDSRDWIGSFEVNLILMKSEKSNFYKSIKT